MVRVAWPFDTLALPRAAPSAKKVTVPVSPEPVAGNTLAVNVTGCPESAGLSELPRPRSVGAWLTVTGAAVSTSSPRSRCPRRTRP